MRTISKSLFWVPLSLLLLMVPVMAKTRPDYKAVRFSGTERTTGAVQLVDRHEGHGRDKGYAWGRRDHDWDRGRGHRRDWDDRYGGRRYYAPYYYGYNYNYPYYYGYPHNYNYPYYYGGPGFSFRLWR